MDQFVVSEKEAQERIDRLLANRYPDHSRTYFQALIDEGGVRLNGTVVKKRELARAGDEIAVSLRPPPATSLLPEAIPLQILYEDEHLLAIDKPPNMVVHPAPGHRSGTFANALIAHCQEIAALDLVRPGIVHRLDKETSGVLLAAKTADAHQKLVKKFANREMEKTYLAICIGKPPNGKLSAPIGRHPTRRKEMTVLPSGKEAISEIEVLAYNEQISFVKIKPQTGRTHQIRVHLKHLGTPILGDPVYGQRKGAQRLLLHAHQLNFIHPITQIPLSLCAPIPQDLQNWISTLVKFNTKG